VEDVEAEAEDQDFVVCGWCTPDYLRWVPYLGTSLQENGVRHIDIVEVEKPAGKRWEQVTLLKAEQVWDALHRHPDRTIVFLDVDCTVHGPLDELVAGIHGDVASFVRVKRRRNGDIRWGIRSGTLVLRQTQGPRFRQAVGLGIPDGAVGCGRPRHVDAGGGQNTDMQFPGDRHSLLRHRWRQGRKPRHPARLRQPRHCENRRYGQTPELLGRAPMDARRAAGKADWAVTWRKTPALIVGLLVLVLIASGFQTWAERDAASACETTLMELRSRPAP
jgi:hypothetical protein